MTVEYPQVLVVDDSDIALEGMLQVLSDASIPAIGTPSAIGTTRAILRYKIRVVVVDVNMPVLTGNNLVSLFRNNSKLVGVKVLLVSGLPKPELLKMAAECGSRRRGRKRRSRRDARGHHSAVPAEASVVRARSERRSPRTRHGHSQTRVSERLVTARHALGGCVAESSEF